MQIQTFGKLSAVIKAQVEKPSRALILLHGVGSNEQNMFELGSLLAKDSLIISLRAPLVMGPSSFAWFHVQFTANGPVHNWNEAQSSLHLLEEALLDIANKTGIPLSKVSVFGFSQGAIMTIGLALTSTQSIEKYIAVSGRTLPEFAKASVEQPLTSYKNRKIFVLHGEQDSKLPVSLAKTTEKVLQAASLALKYKEYKADHTVTDEMISDARKWLETE